jgi:hypothetical protein
VAKGKRSFSKGESISRLSDGVLLTRYSNSSIRASIVKNAPICEVGITSSARKTLKQS